MVYQNRFVIPITDITDGSVSLDQLNNDSVDSSKIVPGGIATSDIANKAITTQKLADDVSIPIAPGAIGATELATDAVTQSKLAAASVGASEIEDGSVGSDELAPDSVGNSEMQDNAVDTAEILNDAITVDKIANGQVNNDKLSSNSVSAAKIQDLQVTKAKAELGFGRIVLLTTPVQKLNTTGIVDLDVEVDLSVEVPSGAIGAIIALTGLTNGVPTAFGSVVTLLPAGAGLEPLFIGFDVGDRAGLFYYMTTTQKFFNDTNRTIKVQSTQNGDTYTVKLHVFGYVI